MSAWLDNCKFNPTAGGVTDWTYSTAVTGYQSPALAGVVNGTTYKYFAVSADLSQWEIGQGAYNTGTGVLSRTTVLYNSSGSGTATGQSGAGTKISFTNPPFIAVVAIKEDIISIEEANSFTTTQQGQARTNIAAATTPANWTRQKFLSGSGTYTLPTGCKAINLRMRGGAGGGAGSGTTTTGGAGGTGVSSTFGGGLNANGGSGAPGVGGGTGGAGGAGVGGDINITGAFGSPTAGSSAIVGAGGTGGGGGGAGGIPNGGAGQPGPANSGLGGGGAGGAATVNCGGGGGQGGYVEILITAPSATYTYVVGAGGTAGTAGTSGSAGGTGGSGIIIVDEYY